jgi:hypothetical protein
LCYSERHHASQLERYELERLEFERQNAKAITRPNQPAFAHYLVLMRGIVYGLDFSINPNHHR